MVPATSGNGYGNCNRAGVSAIASGNSRSSTNGVKSSVGSLNLTNGISSPPPPPPPPPPSSILSSSKLPSIPTAVAPPLLPPSSATPPPHEAKLNAAVTEHLDPRSKNSHCQKHNWTARLTTSIATQSVAAGSQRDTPSRALPSTASTTLPSNTPTLLSVANELNDRITEFLQTPAHELTGLLINVQTQTRISLEVIEEALDRWKWEEFAISFNGGKDCLILLVLLLAGIGRKFGCGEATTDPASTNSSRDDHNSYEPSQYNNEAFKVKPTKPPKVDNTSIISSPNNLPLSFPDSIPSVYVSPTHPFPEVDTFVSECIKSYHLSPTTLPLPMKSAFEKYLGLNKSIKAIFVGTRRTDPHGEKLTWFDRTDHGWPDFVRIHPVVEWHYQEVWAFLRHLSIPYCPLYDQGYTSLGGTNDTYRNPVLATEDCDGNRSFRPAYELLEDGQERLGREMRRR